MYPAGRDDVRVRWLTLPNRLRIRVAECGPAEGRVVLLLHGWGGCIYMHRFMMPALAKAGYRAVAIDLPGHGLSDKPRAASSYRCEAMVATLELVLDALALSSITIVGQSLSGRLALELATRGSGRVRALALIGPVGLGFVRKVRLARFATPRFTIPFAQYFVTRGLVKRLLVEAYSSVDRVQDEEVEEYWAPSQFRGYARAMRALLHEFDWKVLGPDRLAAIAVPTVVIIGGADRLVSKVQSRSSMLPHAQVVVIAEGGHNVNETHPDATHTALLALLARTS
ncbi:MAG: hypothetical protein JWO05_2715 [Gemmatimonadetes bacterium]|nr:hypothetical protein [Gemmatimonadota bacterium]